MSLAGALLIGLAVHGGQPSAVDAWNGAMAITWHDAQACSAVALDPKVVLTAAHCFDYVVDDAGEIAVAELKLYAGPGVEPGQDLRGAIALDRVVVHPAYARGLTGRNDVAIVVPRTPLPDAAQWEKAATSAAELHELLAEGRDATMVGFGTIDRDDATRTGRKHEAVSRLQGWTASEIVLGDERADACAGDSGGPLYARTREGAWRVLGIASRGPSPCGQRDIPGRWSLLAHHVCWVAAVTGVDLSGGTAGCGEGRPELSEAELRALTPEALCADTAPSQARRRTLETLRLVSGRTSCVEALSALAGERVLDLSERGLRDLAPLAVMKNLEELNLEGNDVQDLGALALLTKLRLLRLAWNDVTSFAPLSAAEGRGLLVLGKRLQQGSFTDTEFLRLCRRGGGEDFPFVSAVRDAFGAFPDASCEDLNHALLITPKLSLTASNLRDLSFLRDLQQLEELDLRFNPVGDDQIPVLRTLERLRSLNLKSTLVTDVGGLDELVRRNGLIITR